MSQTKSDRLAMIKAAAEKINAQKSFRAKQAAKSSKVRRWTDVEEKPRRAKSQRDFDRMIDKLDENHNRWTDESSYAKKYYGDVAYQTTRYDNDWD